MFLAARSSGAFCQEGFYDNCIIDVTLKELLDLDQLYLEVRPLIKDGGRIIVYVIKNKNVFDGAELVLERTTFPSLDISEIRFFGTATTWFLRRIYEVASRSCRVHPVAQGLISGPA